MKCSLCTREARYGNEENNETTWFCTWHYNKFLKFKRTMRGLIRSQTRQKRSDKARQISMEDLEVLGAL